MIQLATTVFMTLVAAACALPAPSPVASAQDSPTPTAVTAPLPAPSCSPESLLEVPVGGGSPFPVPTTLTCANAVASATAQLTPQLRAQVTRIAFYYGRYCPPGALCPLSSQQFGFVVFETAASGSQHAVMVEVRADDSGAVSVLSGPTPFPAVSPA